MRIFGILVITILTFAGCASYSSNMPIVEYKESETSESSNVITVDLIVETTLDELGSFDVTLKINDANLQFVECISMPDLGYEISSNYDEETTKLKIIGYNTKPVGKKGSFKIAHIYFEIKNRSKFSVSQKDNIELIKGNAYSPLPEQKEIDPSFSLALYDRYITK